MQCNGIYRTVRNFCEVRKWAWIREILFIIVNFDLAWLPRLIAFTHSRKYECKQLYSQIFSDSRNLHLAKLSDSTVINYIRMNIVG